MSLKILCAGCSSEERSAVEAGVRAGLGERTRRDPWTVSLVKFGTGWSVTVDGPTVSGHRASFMVPGPAGPDVLADAVRSAADPSAAPARPAAGPARGTVAPASPEGRRDTHQCAVCGGQYALVYESEPDEPMEDAPVACPHCWRIGHVQVSRSASIGRDYRADKL
jgi:DNA-directed RNA polymerase subunit RPC12/RpoP